MRTYKYRSTVSQATLILTEASGSVWHYNSFSDLKTKQLVSMVDDVSFRFVSFHFIFRHHTVPLYPIPIPFTHCLCLTDNEHPLGGCGCGGDGLGRTTSLVNERPALGHVEQDVKFSGHSRAPVCVSESTG